MISFHLHVIELTYIDRIKKQDDDLPTLNERAFSQKIRCHE